MTYTNFAWFHSRLTSWSNFVMTYVILVNQFNIYEVRSGRAKSYKQCQFDMTDCRVIMLFSLKLIVKFFPEENFENSPSVQLNCSIAIWFWNDWKLDAVVSKTIQIEINIDINAIQWKGSEISVPNIILKIWKND